MPLPEKPPVGGRYHQWVRITPEGLRALAQAVERYGLPQLDPSEKTTRRVCADCGSTNYRVERVDVEVPEGMA